jgi:predicted phosphodiesterase
MELVHMTNVAPIAVLADVHGNRWALEAVLEDIRARGIERTVNLGDCVYGPLDPSGTAEILMELDLPTVRGNEDRILVEPTAEIQHSCTFGFVLGSLSPDDLYWLSTLPAMTVAYDHFRLFHGCPGSDEEYLLHKVAPLGAVPRAPAEVAARVGGMREAVLLCGHDHSPAAMRLSHGTLVVNPGSVGLPAYTDDRPFPHAIESRTPHARYAIVGRNASDWWVEHVALEYDWEAAAATAETNGRPDWAAWLRTGCV